MQHYTSTLINLPVSTADLYLSFSPMSKEQFSHYAARLRDSVAYFLVRKRCWCSLGYSYGSPQDRFLWRTNNDHIMKSHRIGGNRERKFFNKFLFSIAINNVFDHQN